MTNSMVGVFLQFRKEEIAFTADIESMFYQVRIPKEQRRLVRFLWWPDGDTSKSLCDYEMCVHVFGAVSSPGCANYALKQAAMDNRLNYGEGAYSTITENFYVDDCLKSEESVDAAITTALKTEQMCQAGGFNLTKFISNSATFNEKIPASKRLYPTAEDTPKEVPSLGVRWNIFVDSLNFGISLGVNPLTRTGMLSCISSHFDPSGISAVFMMEGRKVLQEATAEKVGWKAPVSEPLMERWKKWRSDLSSLVDICVSRCFKPPGFGQVNDVSMHVFSDASEYGYGACAYLRQVNCEGKIHVAFVMSKSRVTPLKPTTMPRLELTAATLASELGILLQDELRIPRLEVRYWVDSRIVLGYIFNETRRFRVFVANRVQKIRSRTETTQWSYTDTKNNPADYISRGLTSKDKTKIEKWINGPEFLWKEIVSAPTEVLEIAEDDDEVRTVKVNKMSVEEEWLLPQLETISKWMRVKRVVAWIRRFLHNHLMMKSAVKEKQYKTGDLSVEEIQDAETCILKLMQERWLGEEVERLKNDKVLRKGNLSKFDPFLDDNGILRIGGRLHKDSSLDFNEKFPVVLPKKCHTTRRIVEWCHQKVEYSGRTATQNELRTRGFWVSSTVVKRVVFESVRRRLLQGKMGEQKMADLPLDRLGSDAPFTYCGVDLFGPFLVKERRSELKRYGVLYTCFASRAIHIETTCSLETDTFLLSFRRFTARRGPVRSLHSDNGTNFVGADNELKRAFDEMDHSKIKAHLGERSCEWITWKRNPPTASHMGGVWERQIRSVRAILQSLLKTYGHVLNDESLRTLLLEAEAIVNSRPLTVENINDPTCLPLSPCQLLTMKSKVILPPPGVFEKEDLYCRKRWRRVQYLANEFWQRWRKEYLGSLQARQKWNKVRRNFMVDDIVLLKEDGVKRNNWPMGRVIQVFPDDKGLVRSVQLKTAYSNELFSRPINKIVLLVESVK